MSKKVKQALIFVFSLLLLSALFSSDAFASRRIDITIIPDKDEYRLGNVATFDIQMMRNEKPVTIKPEQIKATFPDKDTSVILTQLSKGRYTYVTPELTQAGDYTLSVTVLSEEAVRTIDRLERIRERIERTIEWLGELKERIRNPRIIPIIDRMIEP
jgi:hypothetical protein